MSSVSIVMKTRVAMVDGVAKEREDLENRGYARYIAAAVSRRTLGKPMASYQRVALFVLFDALEHDLIRAIRNFAAPDGISLTEEEAAKAKRRLIRRNTSDFNLNDPADLLLGLDLGEKFQVLLRHKHTMDSASRGYYEALATSVSRSIGVRNDVMHGRELTMDEHVFALAFAQELLRASNYWPALDRTYRDYADDPARFLARSIEFLDDPASSRTPNNLPIPDFDDTGFLPRADLERELKHKLRGRHPAVTVLGEGGNGKTALALQVLMRMVRSNDHDFDAILWLTAKTSRLTEQGVETIESAVASADAMIGAATEILLEKSGAPGTPMERLTALLASSKILLVIDNYESIVGDEFARLVQDLPGESKLLFTSRLPVGGDLTVLVDEFKRGDALIYFHRLVQAYSVRELKGESAEWIDRHLGRLGYKPLLIKWFVLGVKAGLRPEAITANPDIALRFCLDNVVDRLGPEAQAVIVVLSTISSAISAGIVQHVSRLSPLHVSDGLSQLSQFGLIESETTDTGDRLYSIKPFSRSFIHRIIRPKPEITSAIHDRYRKLEFEYQTHRGLHAANPYSMKHILIRSRPEMVAAKLLRMAAEHAAQTEFDLAEQYLVEAKTLNPEYFEVHRIEAFVAQQQNDWTRAVRAYESAIALARGVPQLHFFFGGMLMRMCENDRAAEQLELALALDPESNLIVRELARNEMMRHNFERSQELISECLATPKQTQHQRIIALDLQLQLHLRKIDHLLRRGELAETSSEIEKLSAMLDTIGKHEIDAKLGQHLLSGLPSLLEIARRRIEPVSDASRTLIDKIEALIGHFGRPDGENAETKPGRYIGYMKTEGRAASYGFLLSDDLDGNIFVHRDTVPPSLWIWLWDGHSVRFDHEPFGGRVRACNVSRYELSERNPLE